MSKAPETQRKALGKGLAALLPQKPMATLPPSVAGPGAATAVDRGASVAPVEIHKLAIDLIRPNPDQPRQEFDLDRIQELARSIVANGVIQPISVCKIDNASYVIIAGERRWRAAKLAGLTELPVYVRDAAPGRLLELALVENIQRENLNPVETAHAFEQLIGKHGLTHEEIAERTGKDRSTVTNYLRLLKLPVQVLDQVAAGRLNMGHARALLALQDQRLEAATCARVIERDLSVRETERLVKKLTTPAPAPKEEKKIDANTRAAIDEMAMKLGSKVRIVSRSEHSGRVEIEYYSSEDLQRIYEVIVGEGR